MNESRQNKKLKNNSSFLYFHCTVGTSKKLQIDISRLLEGQKYPFGDEIKGLDVSYTMDLI